ncbi:hypothetical protein V8C86DRAFT_202501 [Haematococcus lacustris]
MQAITTSGLLHAAHSTAQSLSPLPAAWPLLAYQARQTIEISGVEPRLPAQGAARLNTAKGRGRKQGRRQGQEVGDGRGAGASIGAQAASTALPPFPFSLSAFKDKELSNLVWAAATLGHADRGWRLRRAVAGQLVQRSSRLRPQALANAAWACAMLGYTDSGFYKAMLLSAGPRMGAYCLTCSFAHAASHGVTLNPYQVTPNPHHTHVKLKCSHPSVTIYVQKIFIAMLHEVYFKCSDLGQWQVSAWSPLLVALLLPAAP